MVPKETFSPSGFSPTAATASAEHLRWDLWGQKVKLCPTVKPDGLDWLLVGTDMPLVQRRIASARAAGNFLGSVHRWRSQSPHGFNEKYNYLSYLYLIIIASSNCPSFWISSQQVRLKSQHQLDVHGSVTSACLVASPQPCCVCRDRKASAEGVND